MLELKQNVCGSQSLMFVRKVPCRDYEHSKQTNYMLVLINWQYTQEYMILYRLWLSRDSIIGALPREQRVQDVCSLTINWPSFVEYE